MFVGLDWIYSRGARLARDTADRLAAIPGVEVITPRDHMATLVAFRVAGWTAEEVKDELGARIFAITRTVPLVDAVRISVGFFNSEVWTAFDLRPDLARITAPTLVITWQEDFITGPVCAADFAAIPDQRIVLVEGCGHFMLYEARSRFRDRGTGAANGRGASAGADLPHLGRQRSIRLADQVGRDRESRRRASRLLRAR